MGSDLADHRTLQLISEDHFFIRICYLCSVHLHNKCPASSSTWSHAGSAHDTVHGNLLRSNYYFIRFVFTLSNVLEQKMTLGFYFSHNYLEGDKHNRGRSIIIHQKIYSCKVWKLHQCPVYCSIAQLGRNFIGRRLFPTAGHGLKFKVFWLFFKSVTHGFLS